TLVSILAALGIVAAVRGVNVQHKHLLPPGQHFAAFLLRRHGQSARRTVPREAGPRTANGPSRQPTEVTDLLEPAAQPPPGQCQPNKQRPDDPTVRLQSTEWPTGQSARRTVSAEWPERQSGR